MKGGGGRKKFPSLKGGGGAKSFMYEKDFLLFLGNINDTCFSCLQFDIPDAYTRGWSVTLSSP